MTTNKKQLHFGMLMESRELYAPLLAWYLRARRSMPWRETRDPYAIWLSETMLQQTQVETVKPYYRKFLEKFPTVAALAAADLQEVLHLWAGLGYYRRAKHLHQAAQQMVADHGSQLPSTLEGLMGLPGVGRYTAGAVGSIAFDLPTPVVDGNVMRVFSRLTGYDKDVADVKNVLFFWEVAEQVLKGLAKANNGVGEQRSAKAESEETFGNLNQALMELGATVCTPLPSTPACLLCPVRNFCRAYAEGTQLQLPVKAKKSKTAVIEATALVIVRENLEHKTQNSKQRTDSSAIGDARSTFEVLMMKRPAGSLWESMWEFPIVSSVKKAASKKLSQLLNLPLTQFTDYGEVRHQLTHRLLVLNVVHCELSKDASRNQFPNLPPSATANDTSYVTHQWIPFPPHETANLPFAALVHKIAEQVEAMDAIRGSK